MTENSRGVPVVAPLSRREIEVIADDLVQELFPYCWDTPMPVPIQEFFDFILPERFMIQTGASDQLPRGVEGIAYPNSADNPAEIILQERVYNLLLDGNPRARFTGAHESGHVVLGHLDLLQTQLVEGRAPALHRQQNIAAFCNPEWQANVFAGTFLMPTAAVQAFVYRYGADSARLTETFMVSYKAAETRLRYMRRQGLIR